MTTRLRTLLPLALTVLACGADPHHEATATIMPSSTADQGDAAGFEGPGLDAAVRNVQLDAALPVDAAIPADSARVDCSNDGIACDDALFCNGVERCDPSAVDADARGCVHGAALACTSGQMCSELLRACSACSDNARNDADGDGHEVASCGGDDCRDDDPTIHPGASELCNGIDDDCDGTIDGAPASAACMASAPAMSSSTCANGSCQLACTDPDADLVAGACVRHDDCAGVSACGPGSCVDGVRSYTCSCPAGYAGTTACADVDECASANDCDSSPAACVNDPGSYHCACPATHRGDGKGAHGCTRKAIAVAAGIGSTCAILSEGKVKCWGSNVFSQLGVSGSALGSAPGQMGDALPYVPLRAAAVAIAVGSDLSCAVLADGAAKCWGYNGYGSCGGSPSQNGLSVFDAPLPSSARSIGSGSGYGFAALSDGSIGRWGSAFTSYPIAPGARVKAFDRSPIYDSFHVCALMESGVISCWPGYVYYGDTSGYGTLGPNYNNDLPPQSRPVIALGAGHLAQQIATGDDHSCALLDNASVKCWGRNDYGQLGLGDTVNRGVSVDQMGDALPALNLGGPAKAIAAGSQHTCALGSDGKVRCWGLNDAGQLGQGNTINLGNSATALPGAVDLGAHTAVALDLGAHSCALLDDGSLKCWGINTNGELGQGDTRARGAAPGTMGDALPAIDVGE